MGISKPYMDRYQANSLEGAVRNGTPWADWEIELLQTMRNKGMPLYRIAYKLNRSYCSVSNKVYRLDQRAA